MIDESTLDRLELFRGANAGARREILLRAVLVRFRAGQVLWTAGGRPRGLFVLLEGRVRVLRGAHGRQHLVHEEGPGGTLGEVPLFEGGLYPATAVASEPTLCVALDRDALAAAIAADPALAFSLLRRMAARVRGLIERLDRLTAQSVPRRLAALLLLRHEGAGGAAFSLGGTQAEVAEELGTVREVVVRGLRQLCEAGVIRRVGRGRYRVEREAALRELAAGGG